MNQLESGDNMIALIVGICKQYQMDPNLERNIINIKAFLGPLNGRILLEKYKTLEATNQAIIDLYGERIKNRTWSIPDSNDAIHKKLVDIISIPGDDSTNLSAAYKDTFKNKERLGNNSSGSILDLDMSKRIETVKYLNYSSLMREEYIIADSRYQNIVNTDMTKIVFNLISTSKTRSDNGGVIVGNNIRDIVQIEVSPFTIPYKPMFANFYNKITLSINEWVTNSYEAYEGGQFHFIFDIDKIDNNLIYLRPVDSTYSFSKPMNYIDNFTLSFGAMLPKITFDNDRLYVNTFDYKSVYGIITFSTPHNLVTGDLIYLSGFTTPNSAQDVVVINEVNRDSGHTIVKKDNYSVLINVDLSRVRHEYPVGSGQYPIDNFIQEVLAYFASKRIMIPFRMKYLTNYTS
jgi:hypothetical protein